MFFRPETSFHNAIVDNYTNKFVRSGEAVLDTLTFFRQHDQGHGLNTGNTQISSQAIQTVHDQCHG